LRVYVETNFVLELVLEQEDGPACESILRSAELASIKLALPAFSLAEASSNLARRHDWRRLTSEDRTGREILQLRRSAALGDETKAVENSIHRLFARSVQHERENLKRISSRLMQVATILPLSSEVIRQSLRSRFVDLEVPDAMVLFSILADESLGQEDACFLSRDAAAFGDPDIRKDLRERRCKFFKSFEDGWKYIGSQVDR
jgi:hypothetical protein